MLRHFDALVKYGFEPAKIQRMARLLPGLLCYRSRRSLRVLENFVKMGFTKTQVIKMASSTPGILCFKPERILTTLKPLEVIGIDLPVAMRMAARAPGIMCLKAARIAASIQNIIECAGGVETAKKLLISNPAMLSLRLDSLSERFRVAKAVGFDPLRKPNSLYVSPKLVRGRYTLLASRGFDTGPNQLYHRTNQHFEKTYGLTRTEIIALDPGNENFHP